MARLSESIESKAEDLLKKSNILNPSVSVRKIAKNLQIQLIPYDFGESVSGAILMEDNQVIIGFNPDEPVVRTRFTIAHEIGHFKLHGGGESLFVDKHFYLRDENNTSGKRKEREANAFAAALLMPRFMLKQSINSLLGTSKNMTDEDIVKNLAREYEVSQIAMSYRLSNLNFFF